MQGHTNTYEEVCREVSGAHIVRAHCACTDAHGYVFVSVFVRKELTTAMGGAGNRLLALQRR